MNPVVNSKILGEEFHELGCCDVELGFVSSFFSLSSNFVSFHELFDLDKF